MPVLIRRLRNSWPGYLAALMGALWLAVFPLWQDGSYSRITRAKLEGMHTLSVATLGIFLLTVLLVIVLRRRKMLHLHPAQLLALGYFAWVALSAWQGARASLMGSGGPVVWLGAIRHEGLQTHLFYASIFLMMSFLRPRLELLLHLAAAALLAFMAVVVMQYADHNPLGLFPGVRSVRTNYEFQGTIGNIDMVSGYLCLMVPLMLGGFVLLNKPAPILLIAGLCGVMEQLMIEVQSGIIALAAGLGLLALLLLTRPELRPRILLVYGGVLMLVSARMLLALPWLEGTENIVFPYQFSFVKLLPALLGLLCFGAAILARKKPGKGISMRAALLLALVFILACLAVLYFLPLTESSGGLWEIQQILHGNPQDSYGSYRLGVWRYTLMFSRQNPLFGTGPDTFYYVMKDFLMFNQLQLPETFDNPHNEYLAILSNNGLPALLLYLSLLGTLIVSCLRCRRREALLFCGAVILFMLQGFFSFSICLVTPMFWAVCGMACAWSAPTPTLT